MDEKLYREAFSRLHTAVDENAIADISRRRMSLRPAVLILAAALALLLAVGAAALRFGGLQGLVLKRQEPAEEPYTSSETPDEPEISFAEPDSISLQGYSDSPEYRAALEWREYAAGCDIADADGFSDYAARGYAVYSGEMADKLGEIAGKYGLELHADGMTFAGIDALRERFGEFCAAARGSGYYYGDGTFQLDGTLPLEGHGEVEYQLRRTAKGVLDTAALNVSDADGFDQWETTSAGGNKLLLALGERRALIVAETATAFVVVTVLEGTDPGGGADGASDGLTRDELSELAAEFDFSVL